MTTARATPTGLTFQIETTEGVDQLLFATSHLVLAGWVGRDREALEAHIRELEAIGVPRPAATPVFYRVSSSLLTQEPNVQVLGREATGEAEVVLFRKDSKYWVTIGSDITDRQAETVGIALSKQMCPKPIADMAWPLVDVLNHWDQLILRSWIEEDGQRVLYQEGPVASMIEPWKLLSTHEADGAIGDDLMMFCGTLSIHGKIRWSDKFFVDLEDPKRGKKMSFSYALTALPVIG
jgi:hypothetical protein